MRFLKHACALAAGYGYRNANVDSTVILERPKPTDCRLEIHERLAAAMGDRSRSRLGEVPDSRRVGPVGEGRSAEAPAVVTLAREYVRE